MNGTLLLVVAMTLAAVSGVPGLLLPRRSKAGERLAAILLVASAACGLLGLLFADGGCDGSDVSATEPAGSTVPWPLAREELVLRVDALSAMFLAQVFVIAPLGALYGLGYWSQAEHADTGNKLRFFYGVLTASMALLVAAKSAVVFLVAWETMAICAFFTITTEDTDRKVREAGLVYLIATRVGTLCLFAMFVVLRMANGSFAFVAPASDVPRPFADAIFLLSLAGFGLKAGVMPMHVWLPGAHANAPSHVSALMSGVLIKTGIYGLVRVCSFFERPPFFWGALVLGLGAVSGVLGVAFAIGQHDLKRLLAYHSVENIGIILMGLGVSLIGRTFDEPAIVALGLAGALLHVWNHGLFKSLLFLSAGAVVHRAGTRQIDQLGGLARRMPRSSLAFLVGAIAICGLPPLNGFVSELFVYLALLETTLQGARSFLLGAFGVPALALIGALAVACFVKVWSTVFLGTPRLERGRSATEVGSSMTRPMLVLASLCLLVGLAPVTVAPVLDRAVVVAAPELSRRGAGSVAALAPLTTLSACGAGLLALTAIGALVLAWRTRAAGASSAGTWDCGYAAPSPRMQYTSSSFAELIVGLFSWALRPRAAGGRSPGFFSRAEPFHSHVPDTILDGVVRPISMHVGRALAWFRWIQHGNTHLYILYILVAVVLALFIR